MIANITLNWPSVIEFGVGKVKTLATHLKDNKRIYFLADPPIMSTIKPLIDELKGHGKEILVSNAVVPEPPFEALEKLLSSVSNFAPDCVVGVGGGSAMDLAKLVAVLFSREQKITEVIGIDQVKRRNVKLITVSTTSGTGSEVTPIAVLTDVANKLKKGVVSKYLVPDVAIVDPALTLSLPPAVTAATGMDAMTHCIETYTNKFSHPIIDNLVIEGVRLLAANLERAVTHGDDLNARTACALGSLYGGLALGPVNTAAVHALAYPLGGEFKISHGVSNSVLLPFVMSFNLPSCVEKYKNIGNALGINCDCADEKIARKAIMKIKELSNACKIPAGLKELGIPENAIPHMAESAMKVTRLLNNNPREVTLKDATAIFQMAYNGVIDL